MNRAIPSGKPELFWLTDRGDNPTVRESSQSIEGVPLKTTPQGRSRLAREPASTVYVFGEFELDLALFELRRNGRPIKLDPRVFSLLHYLLEHHDRVVLKDELLAEVWSEAAVTDCVLPTSIRRARSALGQSAQEKRPIQTLHRRGYRLNMQVRIVRRDCSRRGDAAAQRL